jgi:hypothetical protein
MLAFVRESDFWRQNAASPLHLRKKSEKNGLMKHENIFASMNSNGSANGGRARGRRPDARSLPQHAPLETYIPPVDGGECDVG